MVALYKIVNRELVFVRDIRMDMPPDPDAWLKAEGYGSDYTLRKGRVVEITEHERRELHRIHDCLKQQGKIPSAAERILNKLRSNREC